MTTSLEIIRKTIERPVTVGNYDLFVSYVRTVVPQLIDEAEKVERYEKDLREIHVECLDHDLDDCDAHPALIKINGIAKEALAPKENQVDDAG